MDLPPPPRAIDETLIGQSPAMLRLKRQIERLATLDVNVLIEGPSGSGKELAAELIHTHSHRRGHPWVAINCGAIATDLFESELFGHRAGAFTGATENKPGLWAAANRSTLFLDEIGELPKKMQVKLLRTLETHTIRALGSAQDKPVDVRIIAATNQSLEAAVSQGLFRLDLFHRLKVAQIETPPLMDMVDDLSALSQHLIAKAAQRMQLPEKPLSPGALKALAQHAFPGNVRELEHALTRGLIWSSSAAIDWCDLGLQAQRTPSDPVSPPERHRPTTLSEALQLTEQTMIDQALKDNAYQRHDAAVQLGITERALRYRLAKRRR